MNKRHVGKQNMTKNKTEPAPMGIDLWQHVPNLGQATNTRRHGTGSHEPTCMVSGVRPGFEALHGSRLISEPTNLTPLSTWRHEDKHLTNLRGPTGRLPSHPGKRTTPPLGGSMSQHNGFCFGMASGLPIFNSGLLLLQQLRIQHLLRLKAPFSTGQIFLHKFWFHGTSQALVVGFFVQELMQPCFRIYNFKSCGPSCYPPQIPSWANVSSMIAGHAKIQCWLVANFVDKSSHSVWQRKQFSGFCKISFTVSSRS